MSQVPPEPSCWLLLTICISSTDEEGESSCGGLSDSDKPPCVPETHSVHLLATAHQGLQGPDQADRKLQEEAANLAVIEGTYPGPGNIDARVPSWSYRRTV